MSISSHLNTRSVSVLLMPASRRSREVIAFRWLKFDNHDGALLYQRICHTKRRERRGTCLLNAITMGNFVWLIFSGSASLWDSRYGVELLSMPLNIPEVLRNYYNKNDHTSHDYNKHAGLSVIFAPTSGSSMQLTSYYLTLCIPHKNGASVFNAGLTIPTTQVSGMYTNRSNDTWNLSTYSCSYVIC